MTKGPIVAEPLESRYDLLKKRLAAMRGEKPEDAVAEDARLVGQLEQAEASQMTPEQIAQGRSNAGLYGAIGQGLSDVAGMVTGKDYGNVGGQIAGTFEQKLKGQQDFLAQLREKLGGRRQEAADEFKFGLEQEKIDIEKAKLRPEAEMEPEWKSAGDGVFYRTRKDGQFEYKTVKDALPKKGEISPTVAQVYSNLATMNNIKLTADDFMAMGAEQANEVLKALPSSTGARTPASKEQIEQANALAEAAGVEKIPTDSPVSAERVSDMTALAQKITDENRKFAEDKAKYGEEEAVVRFAETSVKNIEDAVGVPIEQWDKSLDLPGKSIPFLGRVGVSEKYKLLTQAQEALYAPIRNKTFGASLTGNELTSWLDSVGQGKFSDEASMMQAFKQLKERVKTMRQRQNAAPDRVKEAYKREAQQPAQSAQGTPPAKNEVVRATREGKKAVFDAETKAFLRWAE